MEIENRVYTEEPSQKVSVTSDEPLNKDGEFAFCCEFDHHCPCCRNFAPCTLCCKLYALLQYIIYSAACVGFFNLMIEYLYFSMYGVHRTSGLLLYSEQR